MINVARAILKCHEKGVIHRDIKMENIMVAEDLSVKVIDFGYGRVLADPSDLLDRYCGTPYYMPPEIIAGFGYNGTPSAPPAPNL